MQHTCSSNALSGDLKKVIRRKPVVRAPIAAASSEYRETRSIIDDQNLVTICKEGNCPNVSECWSNRHAAFMIMGDVCTRACAFCNVTTGVPEKLDKTEPDRIASAVSKLGLRHVVVTSVTRDDLEDGGAAHIAATISAIRAGSPDTTIEVLTPDFLRKPNAVKVIVEAKPDVFNHNLETVASKYIRVRRGGRYFHAIRLLQSVKEMDPTIFTKSGIMVGLGEQREEVMQLMDDLRTADVDFMTIGQYLQPTPQHHPVIEYVTDETFKDYERIAVRKGFLCVSSSPLTRSSYHADSDFKRLKAALIEKLAIQSQATSNLSARLQG